MTGSSTEVVQPKASTKVVQVTNIAPQATRDQMHSLFGFIGKIEDIRLYPTIRDVSLAVQSRICYVKYFDASCVGVAQHLTNTVFIDRALIVTPYTSGEIPDEYRALDIAAQANIIPGLCPTEPKLPPHIVNQIEGIPPNQMITTHDPVLVSNGLPLYPPLPITYDARRIEEIRRTLVVINVDESITGEQLVDFFQKAGDVKYVRFCSRDNDSNRYALIEFSEQSSIIPGLRLNGSELAGKVIKVYHSTQAIAKPMAKSNEAAQREIEEAMTRVKEAQSMISAAIDPVIGILSKDKKRSRSPSRSRRRSRSRSHSRSRSGHSRRRSRSRSGHRSRHRHRSHSGSRHSHSRPRRSRSRRRSRSKGRYRSRSRERRRHSSRRSRDRKRSRSREDSRRRRRSKDRHRSHSSRKRSHSGSSKSKRRSKEESRRSREKERRSEKKKEEKRESSSKEESVQTKSSRSESRQVSESPIKRKSRSVSKQRSKSPPRKRKSRSPKISSRSSSKRKSRSPKRSSKRVSRSSSKKESRSPSKRKSESFSRSSRSPSS